MLEEGRFGCLLALAVVIGAFIFLRPYQLDALLAALGRGDRVAFAVIEVYPLDPQRKPTENLREMVRFLTTRTGLSEEAAEEVVLPIVPAFRGGLVLARLLGSEQPFLEAGQPVILLTDVEIPEVEVLWTNYRPEILGLVRRGQWIATRKPDSADWVVLRAEVRRGGLADGLLLRRWKEG